MMKRLSVHAGVLLFLLVPIADGAEVRGTVEFVTRRGQRPVVTETLVWLEALDKRTSSVSPGNYVLSTRGKTFLPHVLAIPAGSTVRFPNEDPIAHNLFSVTPGNAFDLGLYRRGAGSERRFESPAIVNVYCNVHPEMSAVIHVMTTPHFTFADTAGAFLIDVPPGRYRLSAWHEQGGTVTSEVNVTTSGVTGTTRLTIDGRSFRATKHLNKDGKPYRGREY